MNKQVVTVVVIVAVAVVAGLVYVLMPRPKTETMTPAQINAMPFERLFELANQCAATKTGENCTLVFEVAALRAQHAKRGEQFWLNQMLRLGDWYTYVGTKDYQPGQPDAPEIKKAAELYDWLLENKPFFGDRALLGYAKLYDSPYNREWARAHAAEARTRYDRLRAKFPDSKFAAESSAAVENQP